MCLNSAINTNLFQGQQTDIRYYNISFKLLAYHFDKRRLWDRDQCHLRHYFLHSEEERMVKDETKLPSRQALNSLSIIHICLTTFPFFTWVKKRVTVLSCQLYLSLTILALPLPYLVPVLSLSPPCLVFTLSLSCPQSVTLPP